MNIDFVKALSDMVISGTFDEHTIEVIAYDPSGSPKVFDNSRDRYERYLLPWRIQKLYCVNKVTLSFAIPDETCTKIAVYFDTVESGFMTKDLALLVGPDQKWLSTTGFLDKVDENLQKAMA